MERTASLSEDKLYRYELTRRWGECSDYVAWVMLNPSTADALEDDPTIRRCLKFTERLGYGKLVVVNLFAFRATDPKKLLDAEDPIGPQNAVFLRDALLKGSLKIAAWGSVPNKLREAIAPVIAVMKASGYDLKCLGTTKDGSPRHPLYLRSDAELRPWE